MTTKKALNCSPHDEVFRKMLTASMTVWEEYVDEVGQENVDVDQVLVWMLMCPAVIMLVDGVDGSSENLPDATKKMELTDAWESYTSAVWYKLVSSMEEAPARMN